MKYERVHKTKPPENGFGPLIRASEAMPGNWVLIHSRNLKCRTTHKLTREAGGTGFDVIISKPEETPQKNNKRIRTSFGSISPNTLVQITKKGGF